MTPDDISNAASLEAWLRVEVARRGVTEIQWHETYLASRSALRALPSGWHELRSSSKEYSASAEINLLRCNLIALVGTVRRTEKVKQAAANAAFQFNAAGYSRAGKLSYYAADTSNHAVNSVCDEALQLTSVKAVASFASEIGWKHLRIDAASADRSTRENPPPLWNETPATDWDAWINLKADLVFEQDADLLQYSFWIDLIDDVVRGTALNWDMLQEIVQSLTPEQWDAGHKVVTPIINGIWAKYQGLDAPDEALNQAIAAVPKAPASVVQNVRTAMSQNRRSIPPTLDAIEGLLLLEIDRLQNRNYRDEDDKAEAMAMLRTLLTLFEAVGALRKTLPKDSVPSEQDAEKAHGLLTVYANKFRELPVAKADEIVGGVWEACKGTAQVSLIMGSTALFTQFGLPVMAGFAAGSMVFARQNAADLIKAAREAVIPSGAK